MHSTLDSRLKRTLFRYGFFRRGLPVAKALLNSLLLPRGEEFAALTHLKFWSHPPTFLDIGANIGQSAASMLSVVPSANVVCFEPNPKCYAALDLVARLRPNIRVVKSGVGARSGTLPFYYPLRNGRALLEEGTFDRLALDTIGSKKRNGIEGTDYTLAVEPLNVVAIDNLNLPDVSFVKIDVQGFEMEVLEGMRETLKAYRPLLKMERGRQKNQYNSYLSALGYVERYWNGSVFTEHETSPDGDVFFLTPNSLKSGIA